MTTEQQTSVTLLPCPFCGGGGLTHRVPTGWRVSCKNCDAQPRPGLPPADESVAVTAWNTRLASQASGGDAARASTDGGHMGEVQTTVRQLNPIVADYGEHFLVIHADKHGTLVGIDHPCDAAWPDVMAAHVAIRDRINERIAQQDGCPFKPKTASLPAPSEPVTSPWASLALQSADDLERAARNVEARNMVDEASSMTVAATRIRKALDTPAEPVGLRDERDAIVAWLRQEAAEMYAAMARNPEGDLAIMYGQRGLYYNQAAGFIEKGQHRTAALANATDHSRAPELITGK